MTPREHYQEAERLNKLAHDKMHTSRPFEEILLTLESAKIEAMLAQCPAEYSYHDDTGELRHLRERMTTPEHPL